MVYSIYPVRVFSVQSPVFREMQTAQIGTVGIKDLLVCKVAESVLQGEDPIELIKGQGSIEDHDFINLPQHRVLGITDY